MMLIAVKQARDGVTEQAGRDAKATEVSDTRENTGKLLLLTKQQE